MSGGPSGSWHSPWGSGVRPWSCARCPAAAVGGELVRGGGHGPTSSSDCLSGPQSWGTAPLNPRFLFRQLRASQGRGTFGCRRAFLPRPLDGARGPPARRLGGWAVSGGARRAPGLWRGASGGERGPRAPSGWSGHTRAQAASGAGAPSPPSSSSSWASLPFRISCPGTC